MLVRPVNTEEKARFNAVASHPTQAWEWGDFRKANGQIVERLGVFDDEGKMQAAIQVTFHRIPIFGGTAGYYSKGPTPTPEILMALKEIGKKQGAVFIKLEPNIVAPAEAPDPFTSLETILRNAGAVEGKRLFTTYTFVKSLAGSQEDIFNSFKSKTRYNIRVAKKHGVKIVEDTTKQGLEDYLTLLKETTSRQNFYAHNESYFRTMWDVLGSSGMMRILKAQYEGQILSAWVIFLFNDVGYYPYGASSREHRDVMANNLMMWEALMLAKRNGCTTFDMWGALGPTYDSNHKWSGFHRFKEGYAGEHLQSPPTYDLVLNSPIYQLFTFLDSLRWSLLRLRGSLGL